MKKKIEITIPVGDKGPVSGILCVPADYEPTKGTGVIIAHGAGNDMNNSMIVFLAQGLAEAGFLTRRWSGW